MQLAPFTHTRDLRFERGHTTRGAWCFNFSPIGNIELSQVLLDPLVCELNPFGQLLAREVPLSAV